MLRDTMRFGGLAGLAAVLVLALGLASGSQAQEQAIMPPGEISQDQVDAFAEAAVAVQRVEQDFSLRLQEVETPEEAEQLQQEAQTEAIQAVEDSGLSLPEYYAVLEAANADPELYAMLVERIQERME